MKVMLLVSMVIWMLGVLGPSPVFAQNYNGVPYYGVYSSYSSGADRFYDVNDRFNHANN
jgi:hypothetical protein